MDLADVDAILAAMILSEERRRPFKGVEAVAVRAILALSRAGGLSTAHRRPMTGQALQEKARVLMIDLAAERNV